MAQFDGVGHGAGTLLPHEQVVREGGSPGDEPRLATCVVWCGMVWYGLVWYSMVWLGMVWCNNGIVWCGMVWHSVSMV